MPSSDEAHMRELRLMAKLYAERGEKEKAEKALEWSDAFGSYCDRINVDKEAADTSHRDQKVHRRAPPADQGHAGS